MTVWRITGDEGGGLDRGERVPPRCDVVVHDTALLRIAAAEGSAWLLLAGEIDVSNARDVARAVHAAGARAPGSVHLDLAGVDFVDVAGLRALTLAARELAETGGRSLVLHEVSPHIGKLFRLIGWNTTPGLRIHCRPAP